MIVHTKMIDSPRGLLLLKIASIIYRWKALNEECNYEVCFKKSKIF